MRRKKRSSDVFGGIVGLLFLAALGVGGFCYINDTTPGQILDFDTEQADAPSIFDGLFDKEPSSKVSSDRLDPQFHLFYAMLSPEEQDDYERILDGMLEQRTNVELSGKNSQDSVSRIFAAVLDDQPDIFWIAPNYSTIGSDTVRSVEINYLYDGADIEQKRKELDQAVNQIVEPLQGMSPFEQEKAVYDLLCERITYDGSGIDAGQTAYSALIEGKTVCSGYSRAFQLIMMQLGHPCSYASGEAQGVTENASGWDAHAWNVVQIEDTWYNVDVTWGDSTVFDTEAVLYRGFNATDAHMSADHERQGLSVQLPECMASFDFGSCFGTDPAAASLESAGYQVSLVADTPDQVAADVANRASDLAAGEQYVVVLRDMDADEVDAALQGALDAIASAYPGRSVSQSGSTQEYDSLTTLAQLRYELS
ncbi:MAG: transglutaminase domain-containing protein [Eggerthellaceae bacterium]